MLTVKGISFAGENSNLLNKFVNMNSNSPISAQVAEDKNAVVEKPVAENEVVVVKNEIKDKDVFVDQKTGKESFIKEYGGITALVVSVLGIPATYFATRKANAKVLNKFQSALTEMTEHFSKLEAQKIEKLVSKKSYLATVLLGLGSGFGISQFLKNNREQLKGQGYSDDEITEAATSASAIIENPKTAIHRANEAYDISNGISAKAANAEIIAKSMDVRIDEARGRADEAIAASNSNIRPEMKKFVQKHYDLWLLKYLGWDKKINNSRSEEALNKINNAAVLRLNRSAEDTLNSINEYKEKHEKQTSLWSLTPEFKPMKLGGLGEVPVDLQNNFTKFGIDNPTFIPMYETPGISEFVLHADGTAQYAYGANDPFNLIKMGDTKVQVFKNGNASYENVEFYLSNSEGKKIVFVKNDAFKGAIYDSTMLADEPEKFAIFNRAVYNLAEAKIAETLKQKYPSSVNKGPAYDLLKAPNSMILNDWHAASMAGLLRYRAPMEYNYNEINKEMLESLSNMPLVMIGHNLKVQGASNSTNMDTVANNNITQNTINTLYDKYAIGIAENAHSGIENDDLCNTVLLKRTTGDKQFNSLFHGISLTDWFVPVSKNYANEIVKDAMQSGITKPLLERRKNTGTIEGIINGTDKEKHDMRAVARNNGVKGLVLEEYNKNNNINKIMLLRKENKARFFNAFLKPILNGKVDTPELIRSDIGRRDISEQEFLEAPLISFAHRLTDQKGLGLLKGAIFRLFDDWEKEFGDKPKPFFLVGGPPEQEKEVGYLYDLKNPDYGKDKSRLDRVIALKGGLPNPAIMAASTFFCAPSTFEPCGLTQGESFAKGTPIIATDTGGYHDTVIDGKTGFLAPYISEQSLYETIVRALKTYYNEPEKYRQMVKNDLDVDFSWAREGKQGPIYEYTDKLAFNRDNLEDIALKQPAQD